VRFRCWQAAERKTMAEKNTIKMRVDKFNVRIISIRQVIIEISPDYEEDHEINEG